MRTSNERGIALVMVLLVTMLMSTLLVGFTAVIMSDQRFRAIDRDRSQVFYAAHSGLEKMTVDLGTLFNIAVAPTTAQLTAIQTSPPVIPGITYLAADGTSGYTLTAQAPYSGIIQSGSSPWAGLMALKRTYTMESTARTAAGSEVHLSRRLETVAIPVFQFGMFSSVDLSFFAGPDFNFGGRVHTNGNLFLAEGSGATLTLTDRVTAVKEIVRQRLSNGVSIDTDPAHAGTISMATAGAPRDLDRTEGSVLDGENGPLNSMWPGISLTTYASWIRTGLTGAKPLNLPIITAGNIDLVRRPAINENTTNPTLLGARLFSKASLRILLSDTAADLTSLPGVTATAPVLLDGNWNTTPPNNGTAYGPVDATHPPIGLSAGSGVTNQVTTTGNTRAGNTTINVGTIPASVTMPMSFSYAGSLVTCTATLPNPSKFTGCSGTPDMSSGTTITLTSGGGLSMSTAGTGLIGGYIKIEMQTTANVWRDVTMEILNDGIGAPNPSAVGICPLSGAIIWLQRLRDGLTTCSSINAADYWPHSLFDPREGLQRDTSPGTTTVFLGGVMYHISLDVGNLAKWFQGVAPYAGGTGIAANNDSGAGYSVYFSDRRNNRNALSQETGEYGWEDFVNPSSATGAPNGTLDLPGEDMNGNGMLEVYGGVPNYNGLYNSVPPGNTAPLDTVARPTTLVTPQMAKANRPILFRRALKLVNAALLGTSGIPGLTIVSENPVYVQGNWNATSNTWTAAHAATSIIADAVTLLSASWDDNISYAQPYAMGNRPRGAATFVRAAIIAGKGLAFPQPAGTASDFGTDGGAHNFLRYLEDGNQSVNYLGSLVTFYYSRQATGTYKCCTTVYGAPTRNYAFDADFLNPALLPPLTPVFRDVNTLGFSEETRPGR